MRQQRLQPPSRFIRFVCKKIFQKLHREPEWFLAIQWPLNGWDGAHEQDLSFVVERIPRRVGRGVRNHFRRRKTQRNPGGSCRERAHPASVGASAQRDRDRTVGDEWTRVVFAGASTVSNLCSGALQRLRQHSLLHGPWLRSVRHRGHRARG